MRKQSTYVGILLALCQTVGMVGVPLFFAADKAVGATTALDTAGEASVLNDPMARQAAIEAAREAAEPPPARAARNEDVMGRPGGNTSLLPEDNLKEANDEGLFGMRRGVIHPYVTVGAEYTDNLYNLDKDRISSMSFSFTPGIWLSLPGKQQIPVTLAPNNPSAGGYQYEMANYERVDRMQFFLLGELNYRIYSEDSNLSEMLYRVQGLARYNFPSGLSLQVLDAYTHGQDRFEIGRPDSRLNHVFDSNSLMGTVDWLMTEKFQARADVSLFTLRYDEREFDPMERDDLAFDLHLYYHYSERTAFYLEYKYIDTSYNSNTLYDSTSNEYYVGVAWDATDKLSFRLRIGFRNKFYDNSQLRDWSGMIFGLQSALRVSDKSRFSGEIYRNNEETDVFTAADRIMTGAALGYDLDLTEKISFGARARYEYADYRRRDGYSYYPNPINEEEFTRERRDVRWIISGQINYLFTEWLRADIGYRYENRDSTIGIYNYYSNTIFADVRVAF